LNVSDTFYFSYLHDLGGADFEQNGTQGYMVYYSLSFVYWHLGFTASSNNYHQTVVGASQNYIYSGKSDQRAIPKQASVRKRQAR
jgi:hemolysin activation/secretion protein